ncbi:MAG: hypothetical protein WC372_10530 [Candidatus Neomarinimicrobiota bacterium]|jgi:hypothetical protein
MKPGYDIEDVKCIAESKNGKSLLMQKACDEFDSGDEPGKCWLPKSQITEDSEVYEVGDEGTLTITEWLAEQRGWL